MCHKNGIFATTQTQMKDSDSDADTGFGTPLQLAFSERQNSYDKCHTQNFSFIFSAHYVLLFYIKKY